MCACVCVCVHVCVCVTQRERLIMGACKSDCVRDTCVYLLTSLFLCMRSLWAHRHFSLSLSPSIFPSSFFPLLLSVKASPPQSPLMDERHPWRRKVLPTSLSTHTHTRSHIHTHTHTHAHTHPSFDKLCSLM